MTRIERRLLLNSAICGVVLTLGVVLADVGGLLEPLELWFYDKRAQVCQIYTPPPTDRLVHVDIDDRALEAIGSWPWRRSKLAEIVDEIRLAGARVVALDVIFSEPQEPDYEVVELPDGTRQVNGKLDHDALFAAALQRTGASVLPVAFSFETSAPSRTPLYVATYGQLLEDLELPVDELSARLREQGVANVPADLDASPAFLAARRDAAFTRIWNELRQPPVNLQQLRQRLLPKTPDVTGGSPLLSVVSQQLEKARALEALVSFSRPIPPELPPLLEVRSELAPIPQLGRSIVSTGFVNYLPFHDGVVRSVPLWVEHRGRMVPQLSLTLACLMLGTTPQQVQVHPDRIVIPTTDGDITVPVRTVTSATHGPVGMTLDIPWFGGPRWESMYDYPDHRVTRQHLSINAVWDAVFTRRKIATNNQNADRAIFTLLETMQIDPAKAKQYRETLPDATDTESRRAMIDWTRQELKNLGWIEGFKSAGNLSAEEQAQLAELEAADAALAAVARENAALHEQLHRMRTELSVALKDKAALIGWIATGRADEVPTSLHATCPGVVVHGAVFNAFMTGQFWTLAPPWVTVLVTAGLGLATALVASFFSPWKAMLAALGLIAGYLAINGIVLFDRANTIVGVAAPVLAVGLVWSGCTLTRLLVEAWEREAVKRRFQSYVDPVLVNYVLEHPDKFRLDGQMREMTVVFTDLGGFTALSERLGEKTVPILNEFMSLMVPVIRNHHQGYVNKFLGDGIMFFFNAPVENHRHAAEAVATVIDMHEVLREFNRKLAAQGLPEVTMRAGISTGTMVVGDAGSADRYDYTVLGDCVNLGSRLESANKAVGTSTLVSHNTMQAITADDRFLARPVGRLQVIGKSEGIDTYEILAYRDRATAEQRGIACLSVPIVEAFTRGDFRACLAALDAMERQYPSKWTELYRRLCEEYLRHAPPDGFDGTIVLTEK